MAPNNLRATPIDSTHIRLDWRDTSDNESGFGICDGSICLTTTGANATSCQRSVHMRKIQKLPAIIPIGIPTKDHPLTYRFKRRADPDGRLRCVAGSKPTFVTLW